MSHSKRLHSFSTTINNPNHNEYFGNYNDYNEYGGGRRGGESEDYNDNNDNMQNTQNIQKIHVEEPEQVHVDIESVKSQLPRKRSLWKTFRSKRSQNLCDATVTTVLNIISLSIFLLVLAAPSVLLSVLDYNAYYFIIFVALLIPCLISVVNTYYSCIAWMRGAAICKLCLIINGFIAFGTVSAALSFMVAIGGTYSLITFAK